MAERVLKKGSTTVSNTTLTVMKPTKDIAEWGVDTPANDEPVPSAEVLVTGVPESATEDILEMLFENEPQSGGGPVESVTLDKSSSSGVVCFEDPAGE